MGDFLVFERFVWFDREVRQKQFPNARKLADHFELSRKTAQRNIEFMRDRIMAPLEYDTSKKGYYYLDETYQLPNFPVTQEEILSVLLARNLLSYTAGGLISRAIHRFGKKLFAATGRFGLTQDQMDQAFSAAWHGYAPAQGNLFRQVADALLNGLFIRFTYRSPATGQTTRRLAEPHHLQHYMASWVLIAWCRLRNDWRKLYLARMTDVVIKPETFNPKPADQWRYLLEGAFGIFQSGETVPVVLRFTPFRARWIQEQFWHPDQTITPLDNGGLELSFPVADFREVKLKILQFGADVVVISPDELRQEVQQEIEKMALAYHYF
jgi:predicted DNA-binding transcriptional regulator YafY